MTATIIDIEDVRLRLRVQEATRRTDGALDRVDTACAFVRSVAALELACSQFGALVREQARLQAILEVAA
jgi:hypothetical protein